MLRTSLFFLDQHKVLLHLMAAQVSQPPGGDPGSLRALDACAHPFMNRSVHASPLPTSFQFSLLEGPSCPESVPFVLCPSRTTAPRKLEGTPPHLPTAPPLLQPDGAWGLWSSRGPCTPVHRPPASLQGPRPPG